MGQLIVRNLDDEIIKLAKLKAKANGKSLEQFLRELITENVKPSWEATFAKIETLFENQDYQMQMPAEDLIRNDRER